MEQGTLPSLLKLTRRQPCCRSDAPLWHKGLNLAIIVLLQHVTEDLYGMVIQLGEGNYYNCPPTKLREGDVFSRSCLSVCSQAGFPEKGPGPALAPYRFKIVQFGPQYTAPPPQTCLDLLNLDLTLQLLPRHIQTCSL